MKPTRLVMFSLVTMMAVVLLFCSKWPAGENKTAADRTKNERSSRDESSQTASPLELMKSEDPNERITGYKRLAREVDIAGQPDLVDEVFKAIRNEKNIGCFSYVFWPLAYQMGHKGKFGDDLMARIFALLDEKRTEVWYGAAATLQNLHTRWENPNTYWKRKKSLTGKARLRLEMAGSFSPGYRKELQTMGDGAYEFLASCATYKVHARCPRLFDRACDMLAFLDDDNAIQVLIRALEQLYANGKCDKDGGTWLAPGYTLRAINKLTGKNYGDFGHDFDSMSTDSVEKVDWGAVLDELHRAFPKLDAGR